LNQIVDVTSPLTTQLNQIVNVTSPPETASSTGIPIGVIVGAACGGAALVAAAGWGAWVWVRQTPKLVTAAVAVPIAAGWEKVITKSPLDYIRIRY
jgi:hypothetical protein